MNVEVRRESDVRLQDGLNRLRVMTGRNVERWYLICIFKINPIS